MFARFSIVQLLPVPPLSPALSIVDSWKQATSLTPTQVGEGCALLPWEDNVYMSYLGFFRKGGCLFYPMYSLISHIHISKYCGHLFYTLDYNPKSMLFVLLIKLFQSWPLGAFPVWLLCFFEMLSSFCVLSIPLLWHYKMLQPHLIVWPYLSISHFSKYLRN